MTADMQPVSAPALPESPGALEATPSLGQPDDQLPPSKRRNAVASCAADSGRQAGVATPQVAKAARRMPLLLSALLLAGFLLTPGGAQREADHRNWTQHEQATLRAERTGEGIKWIDPHGNATFMKAVELTLSDMDLETTQQFRAALGDRERAEHVMQAAQASTIDPDVAEDLGIAAAMPRLTDGLAAEIQSGDTRFYHLFLHDSCYEDGDVVDVNINGRRFATVQLSNRGVSLSVPMNLSTTISIVGVYDGGGGITVACRTSRGEGFTRDLQVGEEQLLAVLRP